MRALIAKTKPMRITHIDLPHLLTIRTKTKDALPNRTQQYVVLAPAYGDMKVKRAALLLFNNGNIMKLRNLAQAATKGFPVPESQLPIKHVLTVGQSHHTIGTDLLTAKTDLLLCAPTGVIFIGLTLFRFTPLCPRARRDCSPYKEPFLAYRHFGLPIWKNTLTGHIGILPRTFDTIVRPPIRFVLIYRRST